MDLFPFSARWWTKNPLLSLVILSIVIISSSCGEDYYNPTQQADNYDAIVKISYTTSEGEQSKTMKGKLGHGENVKLKEQKGKVVAIRSKDNNTHGCSDYNMDLPSERWIALIERGKCSFQDKIKRATETYNATAVVIYNENITEDTIFMSQEGENLKFSRNVLRLSLEMMEVIFQVSNRLACKYQDYATTWTKEKIKIRILRSSMRLLGRILRLLAPRQPKLNGIS